MQPGHRDCTFHMFLEKLCNEFVGDFRTNATQRGCRRSGADPAVWLTFGLHEVETAPGATTNNRCVVCREIYTVEEPSYPIKMQVTKTCQKGQRQFSGATTAAFTCTCVLVNQNWTAGITGIQKSCIYWR